MFQGNDHGGSIIEHATERKSGYPFVNLEQISFVKDKSQMKMTSEVAHERKTSTSKPTKMCMGGDEMSRQ